MRTENGLTSPEIYLRHAFDVREVPRALSLLIYYDDEATVYLNGVEIFSNAYFTTSYKIVVLDEKARTALKPGPQRSLRCGQPTKLAASSSTWA